MPYTSKKDFVSEVVGASLTTKLNLQISTLSTAQPISNVDEKVIEAQIQAEGSDIRYTTDGQNAPTATFGMKLADGDTLFLTGYSDIKAFQAIQISSGGKLNVTLRG